jgi:RecA/RadA recombinase
VGRKPKAVVEKKAAPAAFYRTQAGSEVEKMFGEGVIINGSQIIDNPAEVISLSPMMDFALGGGLQVGTIVVMGGPARCGKTTTALHFAAKWQARGYKVVYDYVEGGRLQPRDLTGIDGLDPEKIEIIKSIKGRTLTTQDHLLAVEKYLTQETNMLVIIDSFSAMCEEREMDGDYNTETRGNSGRLIGKFCRRMASVIPTNENIVIGINHVYSNTSGFGKNTKESISSKLNYGLSTKLYCEKFDPWYGETSDILLGQMVYWQVERSPLGPPNAKVTSYIRYGRGIDEVKESIEIGERVGLIHHPEKSSWYTLNFLTDTPKVQGEAKVYQRMEENPEEFSTLLSAINERIA